MDAFPSTLVDASVALLKNHKEQVHIGKDLTTDQPSAFVQVNASAYIHDDPEIQDMVTLVNSGLEPVDIPIAMLLTYTNCIKKEQACSLLELAIASNALQLFVIQCDYWKNATCSSLRGIPIINTERLLQAVEPSKVGEQTCFPTSNTMVVEDVAYTIQIHVDQVNAVSGLKKTRQSLTLSHRNPSLLPTARRRVRQTSCFRRSKSIWSASTRSALRCLPQTATRSHALGWASSTRLLAKSSPWSG